MWKSNISRSSIFFSDIFSQIPQKCLICLTLAILQVISCCRLCLQCCKDLLFRSDEGHCRNGCSFRVHWLLFLRSQLQFSALSGQFTTALVWGSDTTFWPVLCTACMWSTDIHVGQIHTHAHRHTHRDQIIEKPNLASWPSVPNCCFSFFVIGLLIIH